MGATLTELLFLRQETMGTDGQPETAQLGYRIDVPVSSVASEPEVPRRGDAHPDYGDPMLVDRVIVRPNLTGNATITVQYSVDGRFAGSGAASEDGIEFVEEGEYSWRVSKQPVTFNIPILVRKNVAFPNPVIEGEVIMEGRWQLSEHKVTQRLPVATLITNTQYDLETASGPFIPLSVSVFNDILAMDQMLHDINGVIYRFDAGNIDQQRSSSRWGLEYEWLRDPGTPLSMFPTASVSFVNPNDDPLTGRWTGNSRLLYPVKVVGGVPFVRPPYQFAVVTADQEDTTNVPFIEFGDDHLGDDDPFGWMNLPGVLAPAG